MADRYNLLRRSSTAAGFSHPRDVLEILGPRFAVLVPPQDLSAAAGRVRRDLGELSGG
jgi:hypothetical protein